jgi:hypothetical protein
MEEGKGGQQTANMFWSGICTHYSQIQNHQLHCTYLNTSPRSFPEENLSEPKAIIIGQGEGMGDVFLLLLEGSTASSPSCSSPSSPHVGRKGPVLKY